MGTSSAEGKKEILNWVLENKTEINSILDVGAGSGTYYKLLNEIKEFEWSALEIWKDALTNVMPHVEVRSRRVGGATFQIPMQIRPDRKISYAIKWMILYARRRNEKSMAGKLASEILAAAKEEGAAVKKRMDTHKMADANKAFSHFRF
jgi:small subunit ribosomal protein S7